MKWKTVVILGAVLFLAGFLLAFIPEYQKTSKLDEQLKTAQLQNQLAKIRELASLSYVEASRLNYGSAREASEQMFGDAKELADRTNDNNLRGSLTGLLTFRDTVKGKLSTPDASVLEPLQQIVQKTQAELKR